MNNSVGICDVHDACAASDVHDTIGTMEASDASDAHDRYRPNVALVLLNGDNRVLWARRIGGNGWQFPQGGVQAGETLVQAALRELYEEVGLRAEQVSVIGRTRGWLHYRFPPNMMRRGFCGQKQVWFLLRFLAKDEDVCLEHSVAPEFDRWCWVDYWQPISEVVAFKRDAYQRALLELSQLPTMQGLLPAMQQSA